MPSKSSPSPPEFTFFTDRDLGNEVPDALVASGYAVERHRDHFPDRASDVEIFLGVSGHPTWMMLTKDKRQRKEPPFIAKIYRPELRTKHHRVPRIEMSLTHSEWMARGGA